MKPTHRTIQGQGLAVFRRLLPLILLFWGYLFLRWHNAGETLPYFIDEIHHMRRSRLVWTFSDLQTSLTPSKFGTYYWLGLFQLPAFPDLWLMRAPIGLFGLLGAAGTYALGKLMFSPWAGALALAMVTVWPFISFYERLALTDPPTAAIVVVMTWWSIVLAKGPTMSKAYILAAIITLMIAFKFLAVPLLIVPFLAVAFYGSKPFVFSQSWRKQIIAIWQNYRPYIVRVSLIVGGIWLVIIGAYAARLVLTPDDVDPIVEEALYTGGVVGQSGRFSTNMNRTADIFWYMWHPLLLVLVGVAALSYIWKQWRAGLLLFLGVVPLWGLLILIAGKLATRYFTVTGHLAAVFVAGGLFLFYEAMRKRQQPLLGAIPMGLLLVWMLSFGLPFGIQNTQDPTQLSLPYRDESEYFRGYTGYALPEAFDYVEAEGTITPGYAEPVIVAAIRVCSFSVYHMSEHQRESLNVLCQPFLPGESGAERFQRRYEWVQATIQEYGTAYLMVEQYDNPDGALNIDTTRLAGEVTFLVRFERPFDGIPVEIYRYSFLPSTSQTMENTE